MVIATRETLALKIYRLVTRMAAPAANAALDRRLRAGKEEEARLVERRGVATAERPAGRLIWIHGASVGESLSVLPVVERLSAEISNATFLVTTGTVTSARLMAERLPAGAIHQYIPLDHPDYVRTFLQHWRPDAALFVESEFWPNLIRETRRVAPFMALINGRMSPKSYADWKTHPNSIRHLLSAFDVVIAQDTQNAERLDKLASQDVLMFGNIKNAAAPLPADQSDLAIVENQIGGRRHWLAASTHPGEEETIVAAHKLIAEEYPDLLTVIAPRHPARGPDVADIVANASLNAARRSLSEAITPDTHVYVADTLGELGLFYRLCDIAFVGGSLTAKGGHNPLEPARLGVSILHGPETFNFTDTYKDLRRAGGAGLARNDRELAAAVLRLLRDAKTQNAMSAAAQDAAEASAERVLNDVVDALTARLPATLKPA